MGKTSAKNKIILLTIGWALISAAMFLYFFRLLDASNQQTVDSMQSQKTDLAALQGQKKSYEDAKGDLDKLAAEPIQPESFFSQDISLVNEIQILEDLGQKYNLKMQLSGINGTIANAQKADTATAIAQIPYSITLSGKLSDVTNFTEALENLSFVTNVSSISVSAGENNTVSSSLSANFYLRY